MQQTIQISTPAHNGRDYDSFHLDVPSFYTSYLLSLKGYFIYSITTILLGFHAMRNRYPLVSILMRFDGDLCRPI